MRPLVILQAGSTHVLYASILCSAAFPQAIEAIKSLNPSGLLPLNTGGLHICAYAGGGGGEPLTAWLAYSPRWHTVKPSPPGAPAFQLTAGRDGVAPPHHNNSNHAADGTSPPPPPAAAVAGVQEDGGAYIQYNVQHTQASCPVRAMT